MKYFKLVLLIFLILGIIQTIPSIFSSGQNAAVMGGLIGLLIFGAIAYFLAKSTISDFNKSGDN